MLPLFRPWHLSERNAPIWAPRWAEMWLPPPIQGHTAPEPKHETIWCESGLMKVQHGAKWVSTTAGWGGNDKTAPWAHCCCWYLCQGIWQLAECLTCAISYLIYPENMWCILVFFFHSPSLFGPFIPSSSVLWWFLHGIVGLYFLLEVCCENIIIIFECGWKSRKMEERMILTVTSRGWFCFLWSIIAKGINFTESEEQSVWNLLNAVMLIKNLNIYGMSFLQPYSTPFLYTSPLQACILENVPVDLEK